MYQERGISMDKFIKYLDTDGTVSEPEETRYEYEIGDIINVNSYGNQYKCVEISSSNNKTIYHFKQGKKSITFDW